jgi:hypothetical protein
VGGCTSSPEVWACQASSVAAISTAIALLLTLNEQEDALWATELLSTRLPPLTGVWLPPTPSK